MFFPLHQRVFPVNIHRLSLGVEISRRGCLAYLGTGGRSGHRGGSLQHVDLGITQPPRETTHGTDAPGGHSRDRGDHANLVTKKANSLLNLLNSGKHAHMTRGLGRTPWGRTQAIPCKHERKISFVFTP